jgi:hypothetical protein
MRVNEINEMAISETSNFEQDERSFQPLIYLEYVLCCMHNTFWLLVNMNIIILGVGQSVPCFR